MKRILAFFALNTLFFSAVFSQETLPFEEKAKYEKFLSQKADDVLIKLLGPNRVKVMVELTVDFTKIEKLEYKKEEKKENSPFKMEKEAGDVSEMEYLMPGFGIPRYSRGDEPQSYTKEMAFPSAFIKKIKVTVLADKTLNDAAIIDIKDIVGEVLDVKKERGDDIVVIKALFAPMWKTIWYNPESLNFVAKYIVMTILGIISLIVVSVGFLKLAGAMNTMAKVQQSHQITMEMGNMPGQTTENFPAQAGKYPPPPRAPDTRQEDAEDEEEYQYFSVKEHQIDALVTLMAKEDPLNVSIIVSHLRKEIREEFLRRLPLDFSAEVIAGLSRIRFIENDTIAILKDELETRLSGAVGGIKTALEAFENLSAGKKVEMAKALEKKHPEVARELRKSAILFDDLKYLESGELSILATSAEIADWINVYRDMDEEFREELKSQLSAVSWKIIEETNKYEQSSPEKSEKSMENILKKTGELIYEGRIKKPKPKITFELIENGRKGTDEGKISG